MKRRVLKELLRAAWQTLRGSDPRQPILDAWAANFTAPGCEVDAEIQSLLDQRGWVGLFLGELALAWDGSALSQLYLRDGQPSGVILIPMPDGPWTMERLRTFANTLFVARMEDIAYPLPWMELMADGWGIDTAELDLEELPARIEQERRRILG